MKNAWEGRDGRERREGGERGGGGVHLLTGA